YTGNPERGCSPIIPPSPLLVVTPSTPTSRPFHPPTVPSSPPLPPTECKSNSHCSPSRTCINERCIDPCRGEHPCATGAECTVIQHRPVCKCPPGFQGNPQTRCNPTTTTPRPDCLADVECPQEKACAERRCVSPCQVANPCSHLAECTVVSHLPQCRCIQGYIGNGYYCELPTTSTIPSPIAEYPTHTTVRPGVATRPPSHAVDLQCTRDFECDVDEMCNNFDCVPVCSVTNPCRSRNALCRGENHQPVCYCQPGFVGNPFIECKEPLPATPPPQCLTDRDCPDNKACAQRKCVNPCIVFNPCSPLAQCETLKHFPVCSCFLGFTGSGYDCERLPPIVERPPLPSTTLPRPISMTTTTKGPIAEFPTPQRERPLTPRPPPPFLPLPPPITIGCESTADCHFSTTCVNKLCVDVCSRGYCGSNADCHIHHNFPECSCPPGTVGDPYVKCIAVATKAPPTTLRPLADTQPSVPDVLIRPQEGTRHTTPSPVAAPTTTRAPEKTYTQPTTVHHTTLPITVGCESNDDCPFDNTCINRLCGDVCSPSLCADNAHCQTFANRPTCSCPPGTSGNPTIKCTALLTEEVPTQLPPVAGKQPTSPSPPIRPLPGPLHTMPPPLVVEPPTSRPPQEMPQIHIPPIVSPIVIACENNDDCTVDNTCYNKLCFDVCSLGICGENANCKVAKHRPVCTCPPGTTGDPTGKCIALVTERPTMTPPIVGTLEPKDFGHIHPVSATTSPGLPPMAEHPTPRPRPPSVTQPPQPPTPGPVPVGCESTDECPFDNSCVNKLCLDICHPGFCGENADCQTVGHRPTCKCPPGTSGNPNIKCSALAVETPPAPIPPVAGDKPPSEETIIHPIPGPTSPGPPPLVEQPTRPPPDPPIERPPPPVIVPQVPIACENNDECDVDNSCLNKLCYDACSLGVCGDEADCKTISHRPVCLCPPGTTGDPQVRCIAIATERPLVVTVPPIAEHPPDSHTPIRPVPGPTSTPPSPVAQLPVPRPTEAPIALPPAVPTPPPNPIGCESTGECPFDNSCINRLCLDVCHPGFCGEAADCKTLGHRPTCVCPPGTTGNPTERCTALATERPITHRPVAGISSLPPGDPVVPASGTTTPTPPPLVELPTTAPPVPTSPRPPPLPVVPPIVIACENNDDCASDNSCLNNLCYDVCGLGVCGDNAECKITSHRPVCTCPPGTTGDPLHSCVSIVTERPVGPTPPMAEFSPAQPGDPVHPISAPTSPGQPPVAEHPTPRPRPPPVTESPPPPTPGPLPVGCESTDECPFDNSCVNKLCLDICYPGFCGENADCQTIGHRPTCKCPPGTSGNPNIKCSALAVETPPAPIPPVAGDKPPSEETVIQPIPGPTSPGPPPLVEQPTRPPPDPPIERPPPPVIVPLVPIACENNDECDVDNSCLNKLCYDACSLGVCGDEADCKTISHRPVCLCPPGTTGDPQVGCIAIATERPLVVTVPPIAEHPPDSHTPIRPVPGPTSTPPSPVAQLPVPRPTEAPIALPPAVPTPPPNPIGCESTGECPFDNSCINRLCLDVCHPGFCGEAADCKTLGHRPTCVCPPGTTGNPTERCTALATERPITHRPVAGISSLPPGDPVVPASGTTTPTPPPLVELPTTAPPVPTSPRPPPLPVVPPIVIACENNDDCASDNSCLNNLCYDVCGLGVCGDNAECKITSHRPVCTCPPGTTGDPLHSCVSIVTERPVGPTPPMAEFPPAQPGDPVVPASGTATPTPPPLVELPTTAPPVPTSPRPPPLPVVPPIVIACENNDDCASDNSCLNNLCYDVCGLGVCGDNAECKITSHRPVCTCPPGTTGDPLHSCVSIVTERPVGPTPPMAEFPPAQPGDPVHPISAPTSPGQPPVAEHPTPRPRPPPVTEPPPPPTPGPVPVGCESTDECPFDNSCVNKFCLDICHPGFCGENADCVTSEHRPFCKCPPGTTGNPTVKCSALAVETPPAPIPPVAGDKPPSEETVIHPIAGPTSPGPPPLVEQPTRPPPDPPIERPPPPVIVPLVPIACENNDECDVDNSCINLLCYDVCSLKSCGDDAQCVSVKHRPVCLCPPGTTGDPQVGCKATSTERITTLPPVTHRPPQQPHIPIRPITGPSSERPPPLAEQVSVEPLEPLTTPRPPVPTPSSIIVGCESNDHCPFDNTCVNRYCLDVCYPGLCGENANCQTFGHRPSCTCPPGTTGNPTRHCSAHMTDRPATVPPLTEIPKSPDVLTIIPIVGPTITPLPPLAEMPTSRPTEAMQPPPLPLPIIPDIAIACQNNDECTVDNSCINNLCYDVCSLGVCGENAKCKVDNHRPVCSCPPGTSGTPPQQCVSLLTERPVTPHPPIAEFPPAYPGDPIRPVTESTSPGQPPVAEHPTPRPRPPPVTEPLPPPTPGPVPVGCESTDECPFDNSCVNKLCLDICHPGLCGENADCQTVGHRPTCKCPPGTTGNPNIKCSALAVDTPPAPIPPVAGDKPPSEETVIHPIAGPTSPGPPPLVEQPTRPPPDPPVSSPPPSPLIPFISIACENNDDCDFDNTCLNMLCYDACNIGICGENADCRTVSHRPVCLCPPGTTGNPQIKCTALLFASSTTVSPITEVPLTPLESIRPISDTTSRPPPIAETSQPRPPLPAPSRPPTPVSIPPIIVGCEKNDQCNFDTTCINRLCMDICSPKLCGVNAECQTIGHRPLCVCPPGTTGNPTERCHSLATDRPVTSSPIAGQPHTPQYQPPEPVPGPTITTPPPLVEMPTTRPPSLITTTIPPPIIPSIAIACGNNDDCTTDNSCVNNLCYDVCALGICGDDADCRIANHRPVCTCPPGTTGDPLHSCVSIVTERPVGPTPPMAEFPPVQPKEPIHPISAPTSPGQPPVAEHPTPRPRPPPVTEPPPPPTPGPVPVGCESTDECPFDNSCVNKLCLDICYPGFCGENADCQTVGHRATCKCPPGTTGNPNIKCSALAVETPPAPIPPVAGDKPPSEETVIHPIAGPTSPGPPPLVEQPTRPPPDPPIERPPPPVIVPLVPIACENNDECDVDNSCLNKLCYDACSLGVCGDEADCTTISHRPVCLCPPGTTGDPQVGCIAIATERPLVVTVPPIAEHPPDSHTPIRPVPGPTSTPPSPVAQLPVPRPTEAPIALPPAVPTPPPNPIGCESTGECPFDNSCINRLCLDVCHPGFCGEAADCKTLGHRPTCVCPPGTTGNPTERCTALATERPITHRPVAGISSLPPGDPVVPASGTTTPTPPPLVELPTTAPPVPTSPRPPPLPVVPPIVIACENNDDCASDNSCLNNLCYDVCGLGVCGDNAECKITSHRPVCTCPPGTTGDPLHSCVSIVTERPVGPTPPMAEFPPAQPGDPVHPISAPTSPGQPPVAEHPTPRPRPPPVTEPPPPPTPGPLPVGCESNHECPSDNSCVNKLCLDICHPGFCGDNADCQTVGHRPTCKCPPGTSGNPNIKCSALAVETPPAPIPPVAGDKPPSEETVIHPIAGPTSPGPPPLVEQPTRPPPDPPIERPPPPEIVPLVPIACENNDECDMDNSCLNKLCYDACSLGVCGDEADCTTISHRPVCLCPPGTTGDPQVGCLAKATERPLVVTVPPIAEHPPDSHIPIRPVPGPTSTPPSPVAQLPVPRPTEAPIALPPAVPTPPPNPIGCESTGECPFDNSCINRLCLDVCHPGICGEAADCKTLGHRPTCVCPPGTTGNPTERCTALATERPITHRPVAGISSLPPGDPVVPASGTTTPTPPPLVELPTTAPPVPTSPRPPPLAVVPPIVIACENNDDCTSDNSCLNNLCYDVCGLGICGDDADCRIANHRPVCTCPPGTTGDPLHSCVSIVTERPVGPTPPMAEFPPAQPGDPVHPISAPTSPGQPPVAEDPTPRPRPPPVTEPPPPPTPGPVPVGCESTDECPFDNSCVNKLCLDICYPGFCGENADCQTIGHRATCKCPPGTTGNPNIKCSALAVETPPAPIPPVAGDKPPSEETVIHPIAGPTSPGPPPLVEQPTRPPPDPPIERPPPPVIVPQVPIACENNDECDVDNSCLNKLCYDACSLGVCGDEADCTTISHRPVCLCPPGTTGDPQVGCIAIATERPLVVTVPPIAEHPPDKAPIALPPAVPTPPPNPIGCESTGECPFDNSCINRLCLDVCHPGICGEAADCKTLGHRPTCVCPPGTTGNPTERCTALATERPITHRPVAGISSLPPGDPVVPASGATTPTPPPLVELPTTAPPVPTSPRPPPLAVVPPIVIACENNDDCTSDNSCLNNLCYDVCGLGICGDDADCRIANHRPVCTCPPGTTGDPLHSCVSIVTERPVGPTPPMAEFPPAQPVDPVHPISAPTSPGQPPVAEHPTPRPRPPPVTEPPPPPTPGPVPVGCESTDECPFDNSCVNKLCLDICYPGFCGENADCQTIGHRPTCKCPPGTSGNPNIKCSALAVETPPAPIPPVAGDKPPSEETVIQPIPGPTSPGPPPLVEQPTRPPPDPPIERPPPPVIVPLVPIACENNDECDVDNSCLNKLCYDACSLGVCGDEADCKTISHRPVCLCPPGTTGDPQVGCIAIATERPLVVTVPPIAEHPPDSHTPIRPVPGPTSTPPSPVAQLPVPRPTEAPIALPPAVPTPPPNPIGCESTGECPFDNSCINRLCLDVCHPGICGEAADCKTLGHRPTCVCPPGTTGNPTERCTALATERPITHRPVAGISSLPPGDPVVPASGTTTPTPPPLVELPTTAPPVPTSPRPPPLAVVPPIVIACENNDDCTSDNSCLNNLCYDVCGLGICGDDADCRIANHRPVCTCPPGTTGDPLHSCVSIVTERPVGPTPPMAEFPPAQPGDPVHPISAPTSPGQPPVAEHPTPRPRPPPVTEPPPSPTPGPVPVGCESTDECPFDNSCVNKLCLDICHPGFCGENADCQTVGHRATCKCPPGTTGNPNIKCSALAVETPPAPIPPVAGDKPPSEETVIHPIAGPTSPGSPPLVEQPTRPPPDPPIERPPPPVIVPLVPIACENNDECDVDNSCLNKLCYDACSLGVCGDEADCTTISHRPVCLCPPGTTGDPQVGCIAIATERPLVVTVPPIAEHPPDSHTPIRPVPGPTSTPPSPVAQLPVPRPTEAPIALPPAVPTPPPNPIGCESTGECPFDNSCINRLCLDVCHPGICGEAADCKTLGHRPTCVCPPGTTGNPTERCTALATERPITHRPVAGISSLPPGDPVVPASGTTTPTPPPLVELPTTAPPVPTSPRPPPLAVVPPIVIACENNDDCTSDNSCLNNLCYDVCGLGICGDDADCRIANHRPVCTCPPGTTGDPLHSCVSIVTERPVGPTPPTAEFPPAQPGDPVHPISAPTSPGQPPVAEHPTPRPRPPPVTEPPPSPTPGPVPVGCESTDECPFDNSCVNKLCLDICHPGFCGENADCQTVGHRATCKCPPGTTGNPNIKCSALAVETPPAPIPPVAGDKPPSEETVIHPIAGPTSPGSPPLVEQPTRPPPDPPIERPPPPVIVPLVPIACENNDECDVDNSCLNKLCYDACSLGVCGDEADCTTISHRPVCLCPPGTTGDPQVGCIAIATERPLVVTVPPIAEHPPDSHTPIRPVPGPTSTPPSPVAQLPVPRPTEAPIALPPAVPTPPPNPIGCESTGECPFDNSCINRLCLDVCHPGICGEAADCKTLGHRPTCVCPPGTTGNPTERCTALATERPITHRPVAGISSLPPGDPVVPASGTTTPTPPPLVELPTTAPPVPTSPRPPPLAVVPPIVIACENNDDCTSDNSCLNNLCYDVCGLGICGDDADCRIANHRPVCTCPPGTTGDPLHSCVSIVTERPVGPTPPTAEFPPAQPGDPVHPISAPTSPGQPPVAEHPTPRPRPPPVTEPPPSPTPGPVPVGCESTDECPFDNSCVNKLCLDICYPGFCGENADCQTIGHRATCKCPPGTTGNPNIKCSALAVDIPAPIPPVAGDKPPSEETVFHPIAGPTSPGPPPLVEQPTRPPPDPPIERPPPPVIVPLVPIACENNDGCDVDNSCLNKLCYDACSLGVCGDEADCTTISHRPVCLCPPGTTGDPQVRCISLVTVRPETVRPMTDVTPLHPQKPVRPISGPTEPPVPPVVSLSPPRPPDGPIPFVPPVPTPPPIPVGCSSNDECPFDNTCVNKLCLNVCYPGLCGHNADCQTTGHRPECVCPSGTTGNPTVACTSLTTERPVTPEPPLGVTISPPPAQPIVPVGGPTSPSPDPIVITPTTRPTQHPLPRPPIPPIQPPIIIACQNKDECPTDNSCVNHICYDVCGLGICGENSDCQIFNHRPVCSCPPGTTGTPTEGCQALTMHTTTQSTPITGTPPSSTYDPVIAVGVPPSTSQTPLGEPGTPRPILPPVIRPPPPPTAPPMPIGCASTAECPYDNSCVNKLCLDVCHPGLCGENADCQTRVHRVECTCPPGTTGNPTLKCSALAVLEPSTPAPPLSGDHSPPPDHPIRPVSAPTSTQLPPIIQLPTARPTEPPFSAPPPQPIVPPILIACENNDDCDLDNSCINLLCYPVCALGICGENADCKTLDHRPVCVCPSGTTGNPQHYCQALEAKLPTTKAPPIVETSPHPKEPIMPLSGPTSPTPPPMVQTQPPREKPTPLTRPPPPATDPPMPIGCSTSGECAFDEQCYNRICGKVCGVQLCDPNSECIAQMHHAICSPTVPMIERPQCVVDQDCFTTQVCTSNVCRDVCLTSNPCAPMAVCTAENHRPHCNCPPGYIGNPFTSCRRPEPPTPPPIQVLTTPKPDCIVDSDCPYHLACINQQCLDPCIHRDVCGFNAECIVTVHTPTCLCSPGYTGNPYVRCYPPTTPAPTPAPPVLKPQCIRNEDCHADQACYNGNCQNPCLVANPCSPTALCDAVRHRAVCSCPRGMTGDPYLQCTTSKMFSGLSPTLDFLLFTHARARCMFTLVPVNIFV
ncbi:Nidogen-like 1, partial [Homarus americanus]